MVVEKNLIVHCISMIHVLPMYLASNCFLLFFACADWWWDWHRHVRDLEDDWCELAAVHPHLLWLGWCPGDWCLLLCLHLLHWWVFLCRQFVSTPCVWSLTPRMREGISNCKWTSSSSLCRCVWPISHQHGLCAALPGCDGVRDQGHVVHHEGEELRCILGSIRRV